MRVRGVMLLRVWWDLPLLGGGGGVCEIFLVLFSLRELRSRLSE